MKSDFCRKKTIMLKKVLAHREQTPGRIAAPSLKKKGKETTAPVQKGKKKSQIARRRPTIWGEAQVRGLLQTGFPTKGNSAEGLKKRKSSPSTTDSKENKRGDWGRKQNQAGVQ